MKTSFLNGPHPVITGIMAGQTPQELIAEAKNAEFDGAHGIAISLEDLKPEFLTQVFGTVLGYTLFSADLDHWELRPRS